MLLTDQLAMLLTQVRWKGSSLCVIGRPLDIAALGLNKSIVCSCIAERLCCVLTSVKQLKAKVEGSRDVACEYLLSSSVPFYLYAFAIVQGASFL